MRILIIGGSGLLGNQLINDLTPNRKNFVYATYNNHQLTKKSNLVFSNLNILSNKNVNRIIKLYDWDIVLHTASIGDVDFCESNRKAAWEINVTGTKNIASACNKNRRNLVFFSTNAVYDGNAGPYTEGMKAKPINFYGKTKLEAEKIVKKRGKSLILRLNTMYGWNPQGQRNNPATWVISKLSGGESIKVVKDVYNSHLWVGFVSTVVEKIINNWPEINLINIGGADLLSRYEFALKVADTFNLNKRLITPAESDTFSTLAPRPKNTTFNVNKMIKVFRINPLKVIDGLKKMRKQGI